MRLKDFGAAPVTARASLRFIWSFDDSSQPFVSSIPAVLQGRGASDAAGVVRLTVPR